MQDKPFRRRQALEKANTMTEWSLEHGGEPEK